jgi:cyclophilin family peptidyl-prolyl cis-trans isomerase
VGTAKRERQKVGRQSRRAEAEALERKAKTRRAFYKWGAFAAVVLAIILVSTFVLGNNDKKSTTTTAATTTAPPTTVAAPAPCPPTDGSAAQQQSFSAPFDMCLEPGKTYTAVLDFNVGELKVDLDTTKAPLTVNNFVALARYKFYDGTPCHRIIPSFMAQCGDPTGSGTGGPGYRFPDELPQAGEYKIGSLAMANSGPNTNGSQFFIITGDQGVALPPNYSLFGQVQPGQDSVLAALDAAGNPDPSANGMPPAQPVTLQSVRIVES